MSNKLAPEGHAVQSHYSIRLDHGGRHATIVAYLGDAEIGSPIHRSLCRAENIPAGISIAVSGGYEEPDEHRVPGERVQVDSEGVITGNEVIA